MSGLTIGLFSLDPMKLAMMLQSKTTTDVMRNQASKVMPILNDHHTLLVTLLLMNAVAMEALPIFLDALVPSYVAIIISVIFVLFLGEIIPQAIFAKNALSIGAKLSPMVRFLMWVLKPLNYPIAKLLDKLLGHSRHFHYMRDELTALVELHGENKGGTLHKETVDIMRSALEFREKKVKEVMTPISEVYMLSIKRVLDYATMEEIFKSGFSRIPVYDPCALDPKNSIVGLLIVKDLVLINSDNCMPLTTLIALYGRPVMKVFSDATLSDMLKMFKMGHSHMAIIQEVNSEGGGDPFYENVGVATLEDIIEEIIQADILDEGEVDNQQITGKKGRFNLLTLDPRRKLPTMLSPHEIVTVYHHLTAQLPIIRATGMNEEQLKLLLSKSRVIEVQIPSLDNMDKKKQKAYHQQKLELNKKLLEEGGHALYLAGQASQYFSLVLRGEINIKAGVEGFISVQGDWSILLSRLLETAEGSLVPDFTAYVTKSCRILRVSTVDFAFALSERPLASFSRSPSLDGIVKVASLADSTPALDLNVVHVVDVGQPGKLHSFESEISIHDV